MPVTQFPDPRLAGPDGLLAFGGDLSPETLREAYRQGIFPWPMQTPSGAELPLSWFCPDPRAILDFRDLRLPRSLQRARRQTRWTFTLDRDFASVIRACAKTPRPGQKGTWITPDMLAAYTEFHRRGFAHSVEVWEEEALIGGIYGVEVDGVFAAESMFHRKTNASKLALLHLIDELKGRGIEWIDIQMLTPHLAALGAREISRDEFLERLSRTRARGLRPFSAPP